jgi:hypothetical protein
MRAGLTRVRRQAQAEIDKRRRRQMFMDVDAEEAVPPSFFMAAGAPARATAPPHANQA